VAVSEFDAATFLFLCTKQSKQMNISDL